MATWSDNGDGTVQFEAQSLEAEGDETPIDDGNHWVGLAWSRDDDMGEDTVVISSAGFGEGEDQNALYYNLPGYQGPQVRET